MKLSQACPKCQSRRLWVVEGMNVLDPESSNTVVPFRVVTKGVPSEPKIPDRRISGGTFDTWICAACGFTEWYAKNAAAELSELAQVPGSGVRFIDTTPQRGPFR